MEGDRPEPRILSTVRSPSAERAGGMQGQTLPIVEEVGEASSTGGRSARSVEDDSGERPRTPAKDGNGEIRPLTPPKDYFAEGHLSGTPENHREIRRTISRSSLEKALPPLPMTSSAK